MRSFRVLLPSACALLVVHACARPVPSTGEGEGEGEGEGDDAGEGEGEGAPAEGEGEAGADVVVTFVVDGAAIDEEGLSFGAVAVGEVAERTVVVRNDGSAPFTLRSDPPLLVVGADAAQFRVVVQPDTVVAPGSSVGSLVRFSPLHNGEFNAALLFAWGVRPEERASMTVHGTGEGGVINHDVPGIVVDAYDGVFDLLPDFTTLTPTSSETVPNIALGARDATDNFALRFRGLLEVPADGAWSFSTTSDDGSRLLIDGEVLVDNDGLHGPIEVIASTMMTAGRHAIEVQFFEQGGGESLEVRWEGPGVAAQLIPDGALFLPTR